MILVSNSKSWHLIIINLLFWLIITIIAATLYFLSFGENYDGGWWNFFWRQLPIWMFWGIVSIPILYLIKWLKQRHFSISVQAFGHFAVFGILFFCYHVFYVSYSLFLAGESISWKSVFEASGLRFVLNYLLNFLIYLLILAFIYGWFWYTELRQSELEKSIIQSQLHEAKLNMLAAQLQPHFLFNALNSISGLMRKENSQVAIQAIADLGCLLRQSLEYQPKQFIQLKQELDFIKQYLKMEKLRFREQLDIVYDIAEGIDSILIPALILQPLVENAIKHGIYKSNELRRLEISIRADEANVYVSIINDCMAPPDQISLDQQKGVGISNVFQRLETIFSEQEFDFIIETLEDNTVAAKLKLPI